MNISAILYNFSIIMKLAVKVLGGYQYLVKIMNRNIYNLFQESNITIDIVISIIMSIKRLLDFYKERELF